MNTLLALPEVLPCGRHAWSGEGHWHRNRCVSTQTWAGEAQGSGPHANSGNDGCPVLWPHAHPRGPCGHLTLQAVSWERGESESTPAPAAGPSLPWASRGSAAKLAVPSAHGRLVGQRKHCRLENQGSRVQS